MTDKIITVHTVHETVDEYGRNGALVGIFHHESEARAAAKGKGWYGGEGSVEQRLAIETAEGAYLLDRSSTGMPATMDTDLVKLRRDQIAAAKAKLTPEELRLLGVK